TESMRWYSTNPCYPHIGHSFYAMFVVSVSRPCIRVGVMWSSEPAVLEHRLFGIRANERRARRPGSPRDQAGGLGGRAAAGIRFGDQPEVGADSGDHDSARVPGAWGLGRPMNLRRGLRDPAGTLTRRRLLVAFTLAFGTFAARTRAETKSKMARVGIVTPFTADPGPEDAYWRILRQGLQERGWEEGKTIAFEFRHVG